MRISYRLILSFCLLWCAGILSLGAQTRQDVLGIDPNVRIGKLPNGLTYYLRHNAEPEKRAYFYIAQKVGSIQEEPEQRGLAHFLEHMCFNGTKHFPGNSLIHYLERIGVKFGADLNAYTAVDETVYNIDNVPVTVEGAIDSCLYILHDWSNDLLLDPEEIDKERGVIQEEWRMRNDARQRLNEALLPVAYPNSKYADCMPIGSMEVVMNFKPQTLRDYYEKWYRPDLQGIVVVGDIDVAEVEAKIKHIFADIPAAPADAAERIYYPVEDNEEPIVFIGSDKEFAGPFVSFYFKHDGRKREEMNCAEALIETFLDNTIYSAFHDRTSVIAQKPGSPFGFAFVKNSNFLVSGTKEALGAFVNCHDANGDIEKGTRALLQEVFRVYRHGFTASEFERAKKDFLVGIEKVLKEKDKRSSNSYVQRYVRHFLDNAPIPSLEEECALFQEIVPQLTVEDLNRRFNSFISDRNMVIVAQMPQNDTLRIPEADVFLNIYQEVKEEKLEPYVDQVSSLPFLPKEPLAGKIVKEETTADGEIHMTLSNGARVWVRKTDFKKDEIKMQALSRGGASLFPTSMYKYNSLLNMATMIGGWGNYTLSEQSKAFTGIHAEVSSHITDNFEIIEGACSPDDMKYMFEMTHAAFLYPHKDTDAFGALVERLKRNTTNSKDKPTSVYADSVQVTVYGKTAYTQDMTEEDYDNVDYDRLLELYKERFSDASGFTFCLVGNIDVNALRPYVEKYLASLPSSYRHEKWVPVKTVLKGARTCEFEQEEETPKSTVSMVYTAACPFTLKNVIVGSMLGEVLRLIYTRTIREEAGVAYSVGAGCAVEYYPEELAKISVRFSTSPEKKDLAVSLVDAGIKELMVKGPSLESLNKVKEYILKTHESNRQVNAYWLYDMTFRLNHPGMEYTEVYADVVKGITVKDIRKMAREFVKHNNRILVTMTTPAK
ncbi:MAG: insulinase family protein [Odoribacter sp.]|nr:insulinase family protein [Odoribacter sp.]